MIMYQNETQPDNNIQHLIGRVQFYVRIVNKDESKNLPHMRFAVCHILKTVKSMLTVTMGTFSLAIMCRTGNANFNTTGTSFTNQSLSKVLRGNVCGHTVVAGCLQPQWGILIMRWRKCKMLCVLVPCQSVASSPISHQPSLLNPHWHIQNVMLGPCCSWCFS